MDDQDDQPTCGKGLARHAALPAKLSELMNAQADTLGAHRAALDLTEPAGREEDKAYATLVDEHREIALRLAVTARRMEGYRTLPMARHDEAVMAEPARMAPYRRYLDIERALVGMLQESVNEGEAMLRELPGS